MRRHRSFATDRLVDDPDEAPLALACPQCVDFALCGGLHQRGGLLSCYDDCRCLDPASCTIVCRRNPHFIDHFREIDGFSLENVARVAPMPFPVLPRVLHRLRPTRRLKSRLPEQIVAIALSELFSVRDGALRFTSPESLAARYRLRSGTGILATGVDQDARIERWWELGSLDLIQKIRTLGVVAVTTPNFSLTLDAPRTGDLDAMKRIATCWSNFMAAGLPAALHVNGRTEHDFRRWGEFISDRPEVDAIAFEFGTGGRSRRGAWHSNQLQRLASVVDRDLALVVRGGRRYLADLARAFHRLTVIDSGAHMKTVHRQHAVWTERGLSWRSRPDFRGDPLDHLHTANRAAVERDLMSEMSSRPLKELL